MNFKDLTSEINIILRTLSEDKVFITIKDLENKDLILSIFESLEIDIEKDIFENFNISTAFASYFNSELSHNIWTSLSRENQFSFSKEFVEHNYKYIDWTVAASSQEFSEDILNFLFKNISNEYYLNHIIREQKISEKLLKDIIPFIPQSTWQMISYNQKTNLSLDFIEKYAWLLVFKENDKDSQYSKKILLQQKFLKECSK